MSGERAAAPVGSWALPVLAVVAAAATAVYLWPLDDALANGAVALLLLGLPLVGRWPLGLAGVARAALVWGLLGVPGAYVFGSAVLAAGLLVAVLVPVDACLLERRSSPARPPGVAGPLP